MKRLSWRGRLMIALGVTVLILSSWLAIWLVGQRQLVASRAQLLRVGAVTKVRPNALNFLRGIIDGSLCEDVYDINLTNLTIDDDYLKKISDFTELEVIVLTYTPVSDAGLAHLSTLRKLRSVNLSGTRVAGPGLQYLRDLPHLEELRMAFGFLTDATLEHFHGFAALKNLVITDSPLLTDAGLENLPNLPSLQKIWLVGTRVTVEGVAKLQRRMPQVQIVHSAVLRRESWFTS